MTGRIIPLPFDTGIFGFPCGRLALDDEPVSSSRLAEMLDEAHALALQHLVVRVPVGSSDLCVQLESKGFAVMLRSVSLEKCLSMAGVREPGIGADVANANVMMYEGGHEAWLERITTDAFGANTRFHLDPAFPQDRVAELHRQWIRNLIADPTVLILVSMNGDDITAYVTIGAGDETRTGHIGLLAVDPRYRRRGIARALLESLESAMRGKVDTIAVMTEAANTAALHLYKSLGYATRRSWIVLHRYRPNATRESSC